MHGVTSGFDIHAKRPIGREEPSPPRDLAVGSIRHSSFHDIVLVGMGLSLSIDMRRHLDHQQSLRIQLAGLLGVFISGIACLAARIV
jgi:hypothetical protein